jgi:hypothetical protein
MSQNSQGDRLRRSVPGYGDGTLGGLAAPADQTIPFAEVQKLLSRA